MSSESALRQSLIHRSNCTASHETLGWSAIASGGLLVGLSLLGRRARWLPAGLGVALVFQGKQILEQCEDRQKRLGLNVPTHHVASDPHDEALWESFPASDPPAFR